MDPVRRLLASERLARLEAYLQQHGFQMKERVARTERVSTALGAGAQSLPLPEQPTDRPPSDRVDTLELFDGNLKYCGVHLANGAHHATLPTHRAGPRWLKWMQPPLARLSLQATDKEHYQMLSTGTASVTEGTPLVVFQGQRLVAQYAVALRDMVFFYGWPAASPVDTFLQGLATGIKVLMVRYVSHITRGLCYTRQSAGVPFV